MPELLFTPEREKLITLGAGDSLEEIPSSTLMDLYPDAFPVKPRLREWLFKDPSIAENEMLVNFIFTMAFVAEHTQETITENSWREDPFYDILCELNQNRCSAYISRNTFLLEKRKKYLLNHGRQHGFDDDSTPTGKNKWVLPANAETKEIVGTAIAGAVREYFPIFLAPHNPNQTWEVSMERGSQLRKLREIIDAVTLILIYPRRRQEWPQAIELRDKIEPRIPMVLHKIEELAKKYAPTSS